ncbi:hypothetical protein BJX61DRAFT_404514 [Aspergillus egyptiacus]|nr:hypothetical protein BJX61DRAFT_404514 [Aspergillus egyptiacus]
MHLLFFPFLFLPCIHGIRYFCTTAHTLDFDSQLSSVSPIPRGWARFFLFWVMVLLPCLLGFECNRIRSRGGSFCHAYLVFIIKVVSTRLVILQQVDRWVQLRWLDITLK